MSIKAEAVSGAALSWQAGPGQEHASRPGPYNRPSRRSEALAALSPPAEGTEDARRGIEALEVLADVGILRDPRLIAALDCPRWAWNV